MVKSLHGLHNCGVRSAECGMNGDGEEYRDFHTVLRPSAASGSLR
jgi:hypothetical protein